MRPLPTSRNAITRGGAILFWVQLENGQEDIECSKARIQQIQEATLRPRWPLRPGPGAAPAINGRVSNSPELRGSSHQKIRFQLSSSLVLSPQTRCFLPLQLQSVSYSDSLFSSPP